MSQADYSVTRPEGSPGERIWHSVLLAYPYFAGIAAFQRGYAQQAQAARHRAGALGNNRPHVREYIARWVATGFSAELYWLVNEGIDNASRYARRRCKEPEDLVRLEQRMQRLGILSPNPLAGGIRLELVPASTPKAKPKFVEHPMPEHIVQLVPEEWVRFPDYLLYHRPGVALGRFVYGDEPY